MVNVTFITKPAGAQVFVDGVNTLKITPTVLDLTDGSHNYTLRLDGYEDFSDIFSIATYPVIIGVALRETALTTQQQYNEKIILLGWAGLGIAVASILISLFRKK